MLETPYEAAERILIQATRRPGSSPFFVAWGNSLQFITFLRHDYAYQIYGSDVTRLVGLYHRGIHPQEIAEDIEAFLRERHSK